MVLVRSPTIPNVFNGLKIKRAGARIEGRHPLKDEHIALAVPSYQNIPFA